MTEMENSRQISLYKKFTNVCKDIRRLVDTQTTTSYMELNIQHIVDQLLLILNDIEDDFSDVSIVTQKRLSSFTQIIYNELINDNSYLFENWIGLIMCLLNLSMNKIISVSTFKTILQNFNCSDSSNVLKPEKVDIEAKKIAIGDKLSKIESCKLSLATGDEVESNADLEKLSGPRRIKDNSNFSNTQLEMDPERSIEELSENNGFSTISNNSDVMSNVVESVGDLPIKNLEAMSKFVNFEKTRIQKNLLFKKVLLDSDQNTKKTSRKCAKNNRKSQNKRQIKKRPELRRKRKVYRTNWRKTKLNNIKVPNICRFRPEIVNNPNYDKKIPSNSQI